ncbi:hypothetical protein BGZ58_001679 [Dissophora ornata]|nr:hypothetical protein BGZ58_001679 [Dissophora ornata]
MSGCERSGTTRIIDAGDQLGNQSRLPTTTSPPAAALWQGILGQQSEHVGILGSLHRTHVMDKNLIITATALRLPTLVTYKVLRTMSAYQENQVQSGKERALPRMVGGPMTLYQAFPPLASVMIALFHMAIQHIQSAEGARPAPLRTNRSLATVAHEMQSRPTRRPQQEEIMRHWRRGRGDNRKKRRYRYYMSSESDESILNTTDESEGNALDSDMPLALHKSRLDPLPSSRATLNSDPSMRLDGPMTEMMNKMNGLVEKCTSRMDKLKATLRKMDVINRRFNAEMRELRDELRIQKMQPAAAFAPQSTPESPQIGQTGTSQRSGAPRSRTSSIQSEIVASSGIGGSQSAARAPDPVPPPPSLKPVSGGPRVKTEDNAHKIVDSGMVTIRMPAAPDRAVQQAFPQPRSAGYRRVFDRSAYQLPIACQPTMAVLSEGHKTIHDRVFGGRRPNPMEINPFSHQTPFDGIAATSSLDGSIHFWNINTQRLLVTVPMKEHRVIPYTETLTWVREDAVVAVSHLKQGASWEPATAEHQNAEPNSNSIPETQTNLITIYFNREGKLAYRILTITTTAHSKAINAVTAVMKEDHSMSTTGSFMHQTVKAIAPMTLKDWTQFITYITLFSGGLDKKYISYDLEHDKAIHEQRLGPVTHILQNPTDPRINVVSLLRKSHQYVLMDERAPTLPVLTLGYPTTNVISRLSAPSWQPEGGLLCTGASEDGVVNVWDVRWNGIRLNYNQRPGAGVVTGDVHFDSIVTTGCGASGHPIFRNRPPLYGDTSSRTAGGPSQILNLGGKRIVHACFHPVKNVMMILNKDGSMAFM